MRVIFIFLFLLLLTGNRASAQTGIPVPEMTATDNLVSSFLSTWNIPGATVAITKDGRLIYNRAFGWANMAHTEPMQPYTLLRIASNSKAITGIAIMKLVEDGLLNLNDTVFGTGRILDQPYYLSAISDSRIYNITVKELLEHTAGWNRDVNCDGYIGCDPIGFPTHVATVLGEANPVGDSSMIKFLLQKGLNFDPGTAYAYSNVGYLVLGKIIKAKTGMNYEDYVASIIMEPLGLCDMHLGGDFLSEKQEREGEYYGTATTLSAYGTGEMVPWQYGGLLISDMNAHGGWISTSADYARMILAVDGFSTVPDILGPATITSMTTGSAANPNYAKGWAVNSFGNWWHTGALDGTATFMARTGTGYTWAIHMNSRSNNSNTFWNALDALPWNCISAITTVPTHNLFAPQVQAGSLTATKTGATTATLSWSAGSGDNRTVLATESATWTGFPKDGSSYTGNATFGLGEDVGNSTFVVYSGTGTSVDISGLDPDKTYHFTVLESYNNSTTGNKQVYKYGCRQTALLNMSETAVHNVSGPGGLLLYPNPATNSVMLANNNPQLSGTIAILTNMLGQQLQQVSLVTGNQRIDLSGLAGGVYQLHTADGSVLRLVIK